MLQRHFKNEEDVGQIIYDLEHTSSIQRAIGLLHMLGDPEVGKNFRPGITYGGYTDPEVQVVQRIRILMKYADTTPVFEPVNQKALDALARILGSAGKESRFYYNSCIVLRLPTVLLYELVCFFGIHRNIPVHEPYRKSVSNFLLAVYKQIFPNKGVQRDEVMDGVACADAAEQKAIHSRFHKAIITPLILIGQMIVFLRNKDFEAIPYLGSYTSDAGDKILPSIEAAIHYWLVNNENIKEIKLEAAHICLALEALKVEKLALGLKIKRM